MSVKRKQGIKLPEEYYSEMFARTDAMREATGNPNIGRNAERLIVMQHISYLDFDPRELLATERLARAIRREGL